MAPLPKHAVIAVTSAKAPLYSDKETTGVFISEALRPFLVFRAAGFEVDIVSEMGKYTPDDLSLTSNFLGGSDKEIYEDPQSEFRQKLDNMPKPADLDSNSYGIFFASAGHAALIDYPTASGLQKIAEDVWANGGVVASVCHGVAIFANVKDRATGLPIVSGKTITGFTNEGEDVLKVMSEIKGWSKPLVEEHAEALGATYKRPEDVWGDFHVVSGRLVTGTNPQSSTGDWRRRFNQDQNKQPPGTGGHQHHQDVVMMSIGEAKTTGLAYIVWSLVTTSRVFLVAFQESSSQDTSRGSSRSEELG